MNNTRHPVSFIATDDPKAARAFYSDIVGLELQQETPFALVFRDGSHVLRIQIVPDLAPPPYTVHGWHVTNIQDEIQALSEKGIIFQRFEHLGQDALGVWTTPDGNKIAWFKDPSGNILSFTEHLLS